MSASKSHESLTLPKHNAVSRNTTDSPIVTPTAKPKSNSSTNSIKLQANAHLGTGLASGTLSGLETDEEGNIIGFDPQKFALGFLGGAGGSLAVSKGFKLAKAKYYEKNFSKFIDDVNKQKHKIKPRFEITKELEKEFRENKVNASKQLLEKLHIEDKIYADYITLAQKHPEYFANPKEAKALTEYIAQNPSTAIPATKKDYELIFSEIKGGKGVFALDLELKGGKHRIRSLHLMKNSQYKKKLLEAKKLGEPVLQFSHVNSKWKHPRGGGRCRQSCFQLLEILPKTKLKSKARNDFI